MRLLSRYILREHLKMMAGIFLILTVLCFLFEFVERWDDLLEARVPTVTGFRYIIFRMPQYLIYTIPVTTLLSTFITLGLLGRYHELMAIRASGISDLFVSRPLLMVAGTLSLFAFFWAETLVPLANREASTLWQVEVKKKPQRRLLTQNEIWFRTPSEQGTTLYHFGFLKVPSGGVRAAAWTLPRHSESPIMRDITVLRISRAFELTERIDAKEMFWDGDKWIFLDGIQWRTSPEGDIIIEEFKRKEIPLPDKPEDFQWVTRDVEELGFFDLRRYIHRAKEEGYDVTVHLADLHFKAASALFSLISGVFAVALALRIHMKAGGLVMGITLSMAVGVLYYFVMATGLALGRSGILPPLVGAWGGNILFGLGGAWLLVHHRK